MPHAGGRPRKYDFWKTDPQSGESRKRVPRTLLRHIRVVKREIVSLPGDRLGSIIALEKRARTIFLNEKTPEEKRRQAEIVQLALRRLKYPERRYTDQLTPFLRNGGQHD